MDEHLLRSVHEEFRKNVEAENDRQNHRIQKLEDTVEVIHDISKNVAKLASNMDSMLKEQEKQGKRLEKLENRDGEKWRKVVDVIGSALIGGLVSFLLFSMGLVG